MAFLQSRDARYFGDREPALVVEEEDFALAGFQPGGEPENLAHQSVRRASDAIRDRFGIEKRFVPAAFFEMIPDLVMGDRKDPGAEIFIPPERTEILKAVKDRLLKDVIGVLGKIQEFKDEVIELGLEGRQIIPKKGLGGGLFVHVPYIGKIESPARRSSQD